VPARPYCRCTFRVKLYEVKRVKGWDVDFVMGRGEKLSRGFIGV
jgi:hypothetical protein